LQTKGVKEKKRQTKLPFILGKEDAIHLLLNCPKTILCKGEFLCKMWLNMNDKLEQAEKGNKLHKQNVHKECMAIFQWSQVQMTKRGEEKYKI
jgi:hypothetical protein